MLVELSEEFYRLNESVTGVLAKHEAATPLRQYWDGEVPAARSASLWRRLAELGLVALTEAPPGTEAYGPYTSTVLLSQTFGRYATAEPCLETVGVVAPFLIRHVGVAHVAEVLKDIESGAAFATLQDGVDGHAPWAAESTYALVLDEDSAVLCYAGAKNAELLDGVDLARRPGRVRVADVIARIEGPQALSFARQCAQITAACALHGLAEAVVWRSVEYAKVRQQFGRTIGSFQAVKHLLADAWTSLEDIRRYLWFAAWALDNDPAAAARIAATAKALAGDAAIEASFAGLQTHGGIGYTWECDLHLWLKRIQVLDGTHGSSGEHWRWLAAEAGATV
jgi:alkylation response protein AidB-like acyl-CoA dehydrogenase